MALREFTDSRGTAWTAWDVPPHRVHTPQRSGVDRRTRGIPGYTPERRLPGDRRMEMRHPELSAGWVCFASAGEKRRLSPPPAEWHDASDEELEALCARAGHRPPAAP